MAEINDNVRDNTINKQPPNFRVVYTANCTNCIHAVNHHGGNPTIKLCSKYNNIVHDRLICNDHSPYDTFVSEG